MKEKNAENYANFEELGKIVKEGIHTDFENAERIRTRCFDSSKIDEGKKTTLAEYVTRMPESQKGIHHHGRNRKAAMNAPQLEAFNSKGALKCCSSPTIDEWVAQDVTSYKDKSGPSPKAMSIRQEDERRNMKRSKEHQGERRPAGRD